MKCHLVFLICFWPVALLSAIAQESPHPSATTPDAHGDETPAAKPTQPTPEMRKLLELAGRWFYHFEYAPADGSTTGKTTDGRAVLRAGPAGRSLIEDEVETEGSKITSNHSITWWDEKAHGYRTLWCASENAGGCTVMSQVGKWEGDQFIVGDEFTKNGKKYVLKEVWSEFTPTTFTQTVSQGEAGKELKRMVTIHATRAAKGSMNPPGSTPKPATPSKTTPSATAATPKPK